jgi:hypothetical protein
MARKAQPRRLRRGAAAGQRVGGPPPPGVGVSVYTVSLCRAVVVAHRDIHIFHGGPRDWIVRADGGRELGHYPSRQDAEAVGRKLARRDRGELLVHDASGRVTERRGPARSWFASLLG